MLFYIFTDVSCEVKGKCTSQLKCNLTNLNKTNLVKCEAKNLLGKCSKFQSIEIPQTCVGGGSVDDGTFFLQKFTFLRYQKEGVDI